MAKRVTNPLPPNLPFVVGLGLSSRLPVAPNKYDFGDGLISFNGQRFSLTSAEEGNGTKPFLDCDQSYGGKVKEVVLGAFDLAGNPDVSVRPGSVVPRDAKGYAHTTDFQQSPELGFLKVNAPTSGRLVVCSMKCSPGNRLLVVKM